MKKYAPPKYADKLLEWYCRPALLEDLQGDLYEYFQRNVKEKGLKRARFIYWLDVLKFLRLYTINLNLPVMEPFMIFKNYVKTSSRNMARNKVFTSINVFGLAISLAVGLVALTLINELRGFDSFHKYSERTYRVNSEFKGSLFNSPITMDFASTSVFAWNKIKEEVPGVKDAMVFGNGFEGDFYYQDKAVPFSGFYASEEFFSVFSFKLIQGNPSSALSQPYGLVLTVSAAYKLFGDKSPLSETVVLDSIHYQVTGVMEDVPYNSHIQFEILTSFATQVSEAEKQERSNLFDWSNIWSHYIYLTLEEGTEMAKVNESLQAVSESENKNVSDAAINLYLQPFNDIFPGPDLSNQISYKYTFSNKWFWFLIALSVIVLTTACFNYTNLSLARSLRRSMEIGIRKVNGATRGQVIAQFLVEALIISLLALVLAFVLAFIMKPHASGLLSNVLRLPFSWTIIFQALALTILTGLLAGIAPSLAFSKLGIRDIVKGVGGSSAHKKSRAKYVLLVFQFTVSLMFCISAGLTYKQYLRSVNHDLGYNTDNILNLKLGKVDVDQLSNSLKSLPGVERTSSSQQLLSTGSARWYSVKYTETNDSLESVYSNAIDNDYIQNFGHELVAGENFRDLSEESEEAQFIVNEHMVSALGMKASEEIVGKELLINRRIRGTVTGVVKDFSYHRVDTPPGPFIFMDQNRDRRPDWLNIKLAPENILETRAQIEEIWKKFDDIHPLEARFYDEEIEALYSSYKNTSEIVGFLATLIVFISMMGFLAMIVHTTESKMKEISIRKVFGAPEKALVRLMGSKFFYILTIASMIAVSVVHFVFQKLAMGSDLYSFERDFPVIFAAVLFIVVPSVLVILGLTLSAARKDPAKVLREDG